MKGAPGPLVPVCRNLGKAPDQEGDAERDEKCSDGHEEHGLGIGTQLHRP
jgi:hypothetical protein